MGRSAQEPLGELLHPLVAGRAGPIEKAADMLAQPGLAPIVSGGLLGAGRLAGAGGLSSASAAARSKSGWPFGGSP